MNKEELIGKLQMVYVGDKNALNELIGYYDGLKTIISELQQENKQLKYNWNKLKKWLEEYNTANEKWYNNELSNHDKEYYKKDYLDCKFFVNKFANEMQELENGDSNGQ